MNTQGETSSERAEESLIERIAAALHVASCGSECVGGPSDRNRRDAAIALDVMRTEVQ